VITLPQLRTNRFTIELKELTFNQAIELAGIDATKLESTTTQLLRHAIKSVKGVDDDPINWTAQERITAVSWYMSYTRLDGPNFPASNNSFYHDYLDFELNLSPDFTRVELGEHGGDKWFIQHLTGAMAESIERLTTSFSHDGYLHWLVGGMAAQLIAENEKPVKFDLEQDLDNWLENRINTFLAYPDSDFETLMLAYRIHRPKLDHMVSIDFDQYGICVLPAKTSDEQGGELDLMPTRFRPHSCLSKSARELAKRSN